MCKQEAGALKSFYVGRQRRRHIVSLLINKLNERA